MHSGRIASQSEFFVEDFGRNTVSGHFYCILIDVEASLLHILKGRVLPVRPVCPLSWVSL